MPLRKGHTLLTYTSKACSYSVGELQASISQPSLDLQCRLISVWPLEIKWVETTWRLLYSAHKKCNTYPTQLLLMLPVLRANRLHSWPKKQPPSPENSRPNPSATASCTPPQGFLTEAASLPGCRKGMKVQHRCAVRSARVTTLVPWQRGNSLILHHHWASYPKPFFLEHFKSDNISFPRRHQHFKNTFDDSKHSLPNACPNGLRLDTHTEKCCYLLFKI